MNASDRDSLAHKLREQRGSLVHELDAAEAGLQSIAENHDSELEERAQEERSARLLSQLDLRTKHEIEEIDAALGRIADGTYGICAPCGRNVPVARLRALPTARHCLECARAAETHREEGGEDNETGRRGPVPGEMALFSDRDTERALRDIVREDGRVDCEEMRIICRHGIVHLDGAVPSEPEHGILLKLVTEIAGFTEVVDRLQVNPVLWEREGRAKEEPQNAPALLEEEDPNETDDIVRSIDEGLEWTPPAEPPPDEE